MIQIKDFQVFENNKIKVSTERPDYQNTPTLQDFLLIDDDDIRNFKDVDTCHVKAPVLISQSRRKMKLTSKAKEVEGTIAHHLSQKVKGIERAKQPLAGQKAKKNQETNTSHAN